MMAVSSPAPFTSQKQFEVTLHQGLLKMLLGAGFKVPTLALWHLLLPKAATRKREMVLLLPSTGLTSRETPAQLCREGPERR